MPPAIEVSHVTKEYRLGALQGLRQTVMNAGLRMIGRPVEERAPFKALDDVSFSIQPGEVVGIIGHNGAGKSTLLKMLARISTPTSGSVKVNGRIAPLIEVGAGFVPDFTGRENVYLNGSILGMSKREIDRKFDEIVDFAEMDKFIDTPVKRYSSGMQVKLAFAVATSIESEILIVDEVLAVGDLAFQRKCFDRMEQLIKREKRTVLLVSHNIRQIERLCNRVLMLDHGVIAHEGQPKSVCDKFYSQSNEKILSSAVRAASPEASSDEFELLEATFVDTLGNPTSSIRYASSCRIRFSFRLSRDLDLITLGFGFHTTDFLYLATHNSEEQIGTLSLPAGEHTVECDIRSLPLLPGIYAVRFGVTTGVAARAVYYAEGLAPFKVDGSIPVTARDGFFAIDATWTTEIAKTNLSEVGSTNQQVVNLGS